MPLWLELRLEHQLDAEGVVLSPLSRSPGRRLKGRDLGSVVPEAHHVPRKRCNGPLISLEMLMSLRLSEVEPQGGRGSDLHHLSSASDWERTRANADALSGRLHSRQSTSQQQPTSAIIQQGHPYSPPICRLTSGDGREEAHRYNPSARASIRRGGARQQVTNTFPADLRSSTESLGARRSRLSRNVALTGSNCRMIRTPKCIRAFVLGNGRICI